MLALICDCEMAPLTALSSALNLHCVTDCQLLR